MSDPPPSASEPPCESVPWVPSDPTRWAVLGLADPPADDEDEATMPPGKTVPDALMWGIGLPGAPDPIEAIVSGVRIELEAFAAVVEQPQLSATMTMMARRLKAAEQLLRWADGREELKPGMTAPGVDEEPVSERPAEPSPP